MTTKLDKTLKREILVKGQPYVVTLHPEGLRITAKGKRKGHELAWEALVTGDAELSAALDASLQKVKTEAEPQT